MSQSCLEANSSPVLVRKKDTEGLVGLGINQSNHVQTHCLPSSTKPQRAPSYEPMGKEEGKSGHANRLLVRVTSFRRRLLDFDNLIPKYFVDCLRYCDILSDDTEAEIDLRIAQKKVKAKEEERTEIEIEVIP